MRRVLGLALASAVVFSVCAMAQKKPSKILVIYDFEGCTGVTSAEQVLALNGAPYQQARESLTADVNAAIAGLKAAGVTEIVVVDGHGSMNTQEPDVPAEKLLPPARQLYKDDSFDGYLDSYDPSFDGVVGIAMHAGAGNQAGFLTHTINLTDVEYRINGVLFNETMLMAAALARNGIPMLMVSGDDQLEKEVNRMLPWVKTAVVKHAVSKTQVEPVERAEASRRIERAAQEAIQEYATAKVPAWPGPYRFALRFMTQAQADGAAGTTGTTQPGGGLVVEARTQDFEEGYRIARDMMGRGMQAGMMEALASVIESQPNGEALM
jgi:D-amino peptidase